jgi:hypothetical protein
MDSMEHNINTGFGIIGVLPLISIFVSFFLLFILFSDVADVRDQLEMNWKVVIVAYSKYYPDTCLQN